MQTTLRFTGVDTATLRTILSAASQHRDGFPSYNHSALPGVEPWEPVVRVEGPELFTVTVGPCDMATASAITYPLS